MSGLVYSALGQGISNTGNSMMSVMGREYDREDRQEEQRRRDLENHRWKEEQRLLAAQQSSNKGPSTGGLSGDALDEAAAAEAGMSLPEYRASLQRFKTGDMSALKRDVQKMATVDESDPYAPEMTSTTVNEVPKQLEQEERAKWKTLQRLRVKYSMGEKYKGLTEGEQNDFETGVGRGVIEGTINRDIGAGAVGAMKGMPGYKESNGTVTDQYMGGPGVSTAVGESQIAENRAQANKYNAEAGRAAKEPIGKNEDLATLQQMRKSAEETLRDARKALTEFDKINQGDLTRPGREKLKQERDGLTTEVANARAELQKISDRLGRRLDETEAASRPGAPKAAAPAPAPAPAAARPAAPAASAPKKANDYSKFWK